MVSKEAATRILVSSLAALLLFAWSAGSARAETWRWTDNAGVVHFSDDHDRIPSRYRKRASVVKGNAPVNIMPAVRSPERASPPAAVADGQPGAAVRESDAKTPVKAQKQGPVPSGHKRSKHAPKMIHTPTTPARDAQNRAEERIRQDRQAVDDAQLPARRAQEQADEQIRKAREKTMGH